MQVGRRDDQTWNLINQIKQWEQVNPNQVDQVPV